MAVTINANGLSIIHKGSGGEANATLPDICATTIGPSTVNIAYGNNAKSSDLVNGTKTVTADGGNPIAIKGSKFSKSTGNEAGDKKGITSGTIQGEAEFISGSPTVLIEGKGVCRLSDQMTMNSGNTMCLGGAQNPSISDEEEEDQLYDLTIKCHYPDGVLLKNASFTITDTSNTEIQSGNIDDYGEGKAIDLSSGLINIKIKESDTPFKINPIRQNNPRYQPDCHSDVFFELVTKGKRGFWQKNSINSTVDVWGSMCKPLSSSIDFSDLVYQEIQSHFSHYRTAFQMEELTNDVIEAIDACALDETKQLIALTLPVILEEGDILASLLCLSKTETPDNVFAFMRYRGKGNPQSYLKDYDWSALKKILNVELGALLEKMKSRIEWLQTQANHHNYTYLSSDIFPFYTDKIKTYINTSSDLISTLVNNIQTTTGDLLSKSVDVYVINTPNNSNSSEGGCIELVVNTKRKLDVIELGWKSIDAEFPLLVFQTKNKMDDFDSPDMQHGDETREQIESYGFMQPFKNEMRYSPSQGHDVVSEDQFKLPVKEHFKRMRGLANDVALSLGFSLSGDTSKIFPKMVTKFELKESGYYNHPLLDKSLQIHETTTTFHAALIKCLSENINDGVLNSKITSITSSYMATKGKGADLPQFKTRSLDLIKGTVLTVHGIWSMHIYADKLEYKGKQIRGVFRYDIQDHFGLDTKDINHKQISTNSLPFELLEGFRSWYLLQHYKGYDYYPFITSIGFYL